MKDIQIGQLKEHRFNAWLIKHPDEKFDRWYGNDERLWYALWCNHYENGKPIHICVDGNVK